MNKKNTIYFLDKIPFYVLSVLKKIESNGYEAYLVGGCVRDLVLGLSPKDWDITTNAKPEEIMSIFEKTVYENKFGTVGVVVSCETTNIKNQIVSRETILQENKDVSRETSEPFVLEKNGEKNHIIEVTTYRIDGNYNDHRHPDRVFFSKNLEEDIKRRDFKMNALVLDSQGHIKDITNGLKDISNGQVNTVGDPDLRFKEDPLRILRAIRFACQLNFLISFETSESILKNKELILTLSKERIRDEFIKIIMSQNSSLGVLMMHKFGILQYIIPELEEGVGCEQGGEHIYDVWNHLLYALKHASDKKWRLEIRLSALFHDIGKPRTRRLSKKIGKKKYTFYGHEVVGAKMAKNIMERLKFSKNEIDLVETLVRNHMFFSDTEQITLSAVRRIITKVGKDHIWDLMKVRECDRVGMNKKEAPYRLRKYFAMIEEALHDPISVKQLKIDGNYLMKDMNMKSGPRMGWILNALLEEVLESPEKNEVRVLRGLVLELDELSDEELKKKGEVAKEKKEELEEREVEKLYQKHNV